MAKSKKISVEGVEITVVDQGNEDYICLTDMAKTKDGDQRAADIIKNWMRNRSTIEFLGTWESINNPNFKVGKFDHFRKESGLPTNTLSPAQWVEETGAIGVFSKSGRYGGTYAHKDIAFEFGSAISPSFKLFLIKEFQRLKDLESQTNNLEWDYRRFLTKVNYKLHTDTIKERLLPELQITKDREWLIYAEEADILNYALFGQTAKQWKQDNPKRALQGRNLRDYADVYELTVLANLESYNSIMIKEGHDNQHRLIALRKEAYSQLLSLRSSTYTIGTVQSPFVIEEQYLENLKPEITEPQSDSSKAISSRSKKKDS